MPRIEVPPVGAEAAVLGVEIVDGAVAGLASRGL
jgi:hypothetical protein